MISPTITTILTRIRIRLESNLNRKPPSSVAINNPRLCLVWQTILIINLKSKVRIEMAVMRKSFCQTIYFNRFRSIGNRITFLSLRRRIRIIVGNYITSI